MREQIANHTYTPIPDRKSALAQRNLQARYTTASNHIVGHSAGIHTEDRPSTASSTSYKMPALPDLVDVGEDERLYTTKPNSSAIIRRKPIYAQQVVVARKAKGSKHPLFYAGILLFAVAIGTLASTTIPPLAQKWNDDRVYGYPRTYQVDMNVGHADPKSPLSHFIAINNGGIIEVIEIPGGDPSRYPTHLYVVGKLFGPGANLYPVTISFADENNDGKLDMNVVVKGNLWVLFNEGSTFRLK
ncbi:MAG: hypothetical protein ACJ788_09615 [Ktedonobacteraceae bacterium]